MTRVTSQIPLKAQAAFGSAAHAAGSNVFMRAVRKHWVSSTVVAMAVLAASAFYTIGQTRIYRATATIQIDPNPPLPLGKDVQTVVDMGVGAYWSNKEYYATQHKILGGRAVARETVRMLNLNSDTSFLANSPAGKTPPKAQNFHPSVDDATGILLDRLSIEPVRDSRLVIVNFDDASPERARKILTTLLDIYRERNVDLVVASTGTATEWLEDQTSKLKKQLEANEIALHDYKKNKRILSVSLDDQSNMLRGEMQQLTEALTRVNAHREELAAHVRELAKVDPSDPGTFSASELVGNVLLATLRQNYVHAKGVVEELRGQGKGDKHPDVEGAQAQLETTRNALLSEVSNIIGAVKSDLSAAAREAQGLSGLFEQAKLRAMDLNLLEIEYGRLERAKTNSEKLYTIVLERSKESDLAGLMRFNNITVADVPFVLSSPVKPRVPVNLTLGLVFGILVGVGIALGRERLDRTIRETDDIEQDIGAPMLGLLPAVSLRSKRATYYSPAKGRSRSRRAETGNTMSDETPPELIAHQLPASNAAECARAIRTSLTFASPDKPYKTILVTSGSPSEGKTTVASTIAITFAQAGQRTLLLDCDLRRSRLHRVFKHTNNEGISSVLPDLSRLDAAIRTTEVPNLSLLAAGPRVPNPAELIQSERFELLQAALRERFDRIIIDSPPILAVTDGAVLAAHADASVLVLRAKKTRKDTARHVVRKLSDLGCTVVGVVLNALDEPRRKGDYYYRYGHYYSGEAYRYERGGETTV